MPARPIAFRTPRDAAPWKRWLVYSPLARIAIFALAAALFTLLLRLGFAAAGLAGAGAPPASRPWSAFAVLSLPALAAYVLLCRIVERRPATELFPRGALRHAALGALGGVLLVSAVVAALWALGAYRVVGTDPDVNWWRWVLVGGLATAITEELVLRGVLFRVAEEGLGTWAALALSSLVFGLLHLGNRHASAWSAIAIAVEAGVLLALVYHVWRSLPACIGVHLGWNAAQGPLYGIPVSGATTPAWLQAQRGGPDWLTGGFFGVEASVLAVAVSVACSLALLAIARRRGTLVPAPRWGAAGARAAA